MTTQLKNIVAFTGIASGASQTLPHSLNINGLGVLPDIRWLGNANFSIISITTTDVTVRNNGVISADVNVFVEHWHSINRVFGNVTTEALSPQPFEPARYDLNAVKFADDGEVVDVYVDGMNGDDTNAGLSDTTALKTVQEVYRKFPQLHHLLGDSAIRVNLAGVDGFGVNATAPLVYTLRTLLIGTNHNRNNSFVYVGPEMVPVTPTTGPATATLDAIPAVAVAGGSPSAGGTLSVRLDFTAAAPGWTVNDFQRYFLRITRGGVKVLYEAPIATNTADTITVRVSNIAPLILNTDTVEIVEPAAQFVHPTGGYVAITGQGGLLYSTTIGSTFQRCGFPEAALVKDARMASFDRCNLDGDGSWFTTVLSNIAWFNCTGAYMYIAATSVGTAYYLDPQPTSATDPIPANRKYGIELQTHYLTVNGFGGESHIDVQYGLAVDGTWDESVRIFGSTLKFCKTRPGWQINALQGKLVASGNAVLAKSSRIVLKGNVTDPGAASLYCTTAGLPLAIDDGTLLECDYGVGVGEWEEVAGYAGVLWLPPSAGVHADPISIIRTY